MNTDLMFSSKTDLWSTPQWLYDQLHKEFNFTLDPCATDDNHKCNKYFTKEQDGLKQDWGKDTVFCNPPYGRYITDKWVQKAFETFQEHKNTIVMLLPARTDTLWFHGYIYQIAEIRFIKGRLKFGNSKDGAPFPSMIVIYRGVVNKQPLPGQTHIDDLLGGI